MRRVISLFLPDFATDNRARRRAARPDRPRREPVEGSRPEPDDSLRSRDSAARGPFALVRAARGRLVLAAANPAACAAGLYPGQALADARAILPGLATAALAPAADVRALRRLADWCGRYTPLVALDPTGAAGREDENEDEDGSPWGGDAGLFLDVTGCAHLFGGEAALVSDLARRVAGLGFACRAGLADTPGAAWAVARFATAAERPWRIVPPGGAGEALAPLPVAALRLGADAQAGLDALGLRRVGDLAVLPRAPLVARFGAGLARRLDQALGRAAEPLSPLRPIAPHLAALRFAEPIGRVEDVAAAAARLAATLCARLEAERLGARRLVLALYRADGGVERRAVGASRPSRDPDHLARLFAERLEGCAPGFGFDAVSLAAIEVASLGPAQQDLAGAGGEEADGAAALIDRLSTRLGAASVLRLVPRETHIPEAAAAAVPALEAARAEAQAQGAVWPQARADAQPRPLRLLARPEPIEATAPVPDEPPVLFRWRRVLHRVVRAEGPERIAPEWWREDAPAAAATRDYYRVEDSAGARFWLYREGLYRPGARPAWYLHGVFA